MVGLTECAFGTVACLRIGIKQSGEFTAEAGSHTFAMDSMSIAHSYQSAILFAHVKESVLIFMLLLPIAEANHRSPVDHALGRSLRPRFEEGERSGVDLLSTGLASRTSGRG